MQSKVIYLDAGKLTARRMIGLDVMGADIEYTCCVGCFYSDRMVAHKHSEPVPSKGETLTIHVDGIQPVREGALVHPELHNAIKVLARLLDAAIRRGQDSLIATYSTKLRSWLSIFWLSNPLSERLS